MVSFYERLYRHMEWADAAVWRSLEERDDLATDAYVLDSLFHIHMVQWAYLELWRGGALEPGERGDIGGPDEVRAWGRAFHDEVKVFLAELTTDRLAEEVSTPWTRFIEKEIGRPPSPATLGDMVLQVSSHSVHHRAQVNRRVRELGGSPPMIDYIGWVWRGEPDPDWPA